ncbi:MAG: DUF4845 domain-containing protein [Burkholderiales bacterium]|nr:MAG: DUF4845 domain-containing protein [Burkholderiales bacterium]
MTSPARTPVRALRARQRGLSLLGLIFFGVILVFGALLVMKVFPTATEFIAIKRAVVKARNEGADPPSIRNSFERASAIDDITSITGKDLQIVRRPSGEYAVSFAYEKRIPLFGPASLVLDYRGEALPGAGPVK